MSVCMLLQLINCEDSKGFLRSSSDAYHERGSGKQTEGQQEKSMLFHKIKFYPKMTCFSKFDVQKLKKTF